MVTNILIAVFSSLVTIFAVLYGTKKNIKAQLMQLKMQIESQKKQFFSQFKIERELKAIDNFEENVSEFLTLTSRSHSLFKTSKLYEKSENQEVVNTITDLMKGVYDKDSRSNTLLTKIKFYLRDDIKEERELYLNIDKVINMVYKSRNNIENNDTILDQFQLIRDLSKRFIESKKKEIEKEYQKI